MKNYLKVILNKNKCNLLILNVLNFGFKHFVFLLQFDYDLFHECNRFLELLFAFA